MRLERCERGLGQAFRFHPPLPGFDAGDLQAIARRHLEHAALFRGRVLALGGKPQPEDAVDDSWVLGTDLTGLQFAEKEAIATLHDHLLDFDPDTATLVRDEILPGHEWALTIIDPSYQPDRDGVPA